MPTSPEALAEARVQFQRAAALAPQSSAARHLVTLTSIAQAYGRPLPINRHSDS